MSCLQPGNCDDHWKMQQEEYCKVVSHSSSNLKCCPTYDVKEDGDQFFFGKKNILHADGLIWCHCELIGMQSNNFKIAYTLDNKTIVKERHIPSSISIWDENSHKSGKSGSSIFKKPPTFNVDTSGVCHNGFAKRAFLSTKLVTRSSITVGASAKTPSLGKKQSPLEPCT